MIWLSGEIAMIANLLHRDADFGIYDKGAPSWCPPLLRLLYPFGDTTGFLWVSKCLLMLDETQ